MITEASLDDAKDYYDEIKDDFIESINPNIYDMICGADRQSVRKSLYNLKKAEWKS